MFLSTQNMIISASTAAENFGDENLPGNSAIKGKIGRNNTASALSDSAFCKFRCKISCRARNVPQPGQYSPVIAFEGQGGKNEFSEGSKKYSSTMSPAKSARKIKSQQICVEDIFTA